MKLKMVSLFVSVLILVSGCSSTQPLPEPKFHNSVPAACLRTLKVNSCLLPAWIDKATEADRRAIELNCDIVNAEDARQLKSLHDECVTESKKINQEDE